MERELPTNRISRRTLLFGAAAAGIAGGTTEVINYLNPPQPKNVSNEGDVERILYYVQALKKQKL